MSWTYTKATNPMANAEKLLELWESFGATGLFRLEIDWEGGLTHVYYLKNSDIYIRAVSNAPDHYALSIYDGDEQIDSGEFWERIPKEIKKILAFHLDQLVV
jgi:hypothetical protein